jgi:hypothetical protein
MSLSGNYTLSVTAAGVTCAGSLDRTGSLGIEPVDTSLAVAHAGVLTTYTSESVGVITLTAGHDVSTGVVDIHWPGYCRYNCDGVISNTNTLTLSGGAGTALPAQSTVVSATPVTTLDVTFDGDNLVLIGAYASQQSSLRFLNAATVKLAVLLVAGGSWGWVSGVGITVPITGSAVTTIQLSNASITYASTFRLTGLQT